MYVCEVLPCFIRGSSDGKSRIRVCRGLLLSGISHKTDTYYFIFYYKIIYKKCSILQVLLAVHTTEAKDKAKAKAKDSQIVCLVWYCNIYGLGLNARAVSGQRLMTHLGHVTVQEHIHGLLKVRVSMTYF